MDSNKFSELHDMITEVQNMLKDSNHEAFEKLEKVREMTVDMQEENRTDYHNLSYINIYADTISENISKCEDALKTVGYSETEISDYKKQVNEALKEYGEFGNITNSVIGEYFHEAVKMLDDKFQELGLESLETDCYVNGNDSHLYIGNNKEFHEGDSAIIHQEVIRKFKDAITEFLDKIGIDSEVFDNVEGANLTETIENAVFNIVEAINEKYGTDFEYAYNYDDNGIEISDEKKDYSTDNIGNFSKILVEIAEEYQLDKSERID